MIISNLFAYMWLRVRDFIRSPKMQEIEEIFLCIVVNVLITVKNTKKTMQI